MNRISKNGFTILELLVVIAIIGILAAIGLASLSGTRERSDTAAFKSEMDGLLPALISICHDDDLVAANVPGGSAYAALTSDPLGQNCGPSSVATFNIVITPTNGSSCTSATLTELGVIYAGC